MSDYVFSIIKSNNKDTKTQSIEAALVFRATFSKLSVAFIYIFEHVFMRYYNLSKYCAVHSEDFKAKNPNPIEANHLVRMQNIPKN